MYWETDESAPAPGPAEAVDVTFRLEGHSLPADYAPALAEALADPLADFSRLPGFGVKVLHLPVSGNGWHRSEGQPIYLSRRVQLLLRVPRDRARAALALSGTAFEVDGEACRLARGRVRELQQVETLYASRVVPLVHPEEDEAEFMEAVARRLAAMGVKPRKMLCGRRQTLQTRWGPVTLRSLMVAEMGPEGSYRLQSRGLGDGGLWGCGLFMPHKSVTEVE
ncbi:type I-MYXAN CRISPR-associated protein Cas6/Cmx6 [Alkalilimnicola ehrlichii]|uniref:type I-MYXAN CRISPR-associated protein Cas6/Cmx6 n=1 Tax=Alkalilimnicola ehrlichii TaxID=351052 RepID=UPI003BA01D46